MRGPFITILLIAGILCSCGKRQAEWTIPDEYDSASVSGKNFPVAIRLSQKLISEASRLNGAPGTQIAVSVDGQICWSSNFGYADLNTKTVVNDHTIFRIASVSKIMTAVAVGKLLERGQLDLDKPVIEYLPELPAHYSRITIRHLVSHRSGIRHYYGADVSEKDEYYDDVTDAFPLFVNAPLLFPPGTQSEYSSYGWVIVSAVIQRVSGKSFLQFLQDEVWTPVGMKDTFGKIPKDRKGDVAHFYVRNVNRNKWKEAQYQDLSFNWAGAGISSNANDLAALGNALLNEKLVKHETLKKMFDQQFTSTGDSTGIGIGFMQYQCDDEIFFGHGGFMPTARSYFFLFPKTKMVIAYTASSAMANLSDENLMLIADLFNGETRRDKYTSVDSSMARWLRTWHVEIETANGGYEHGELLFNLKGNELHGRLTLGDSVSRNLSIAKVSWDSIHFACVLPSHTAWIELRLKNKTLSGKSYFKKPLTYPLLKSLHSEPELRRLLSAKNIKQSRLPF